MRQRLESFKALCEEYDRDSAIDYTDNQRRISNEMASQEPTVRKILMQLDPDLASRVGEPEDMGGAHKSLRAVQKGLGILSDQDEWAANLAPDAPSLIADLFHPHVWAAAAALWDTGKYRVAVAQAAISLSAHIASKAGSSLTERELVMQVFSPNEPGPAQVRLHLPGDKASRTWRSRQEGLHLLAQGAFAGIRNVATHTDDEWPEQVALEHLAILSAVARWADETKVTNGSGAPRQP
jgi:hypothetical protein